MAKKTQKNKKFEPKYVPKMTSDEIDLVVAATCRSRVVRTEAIRFLKPEYFLPDADADNRNDDPSTGMSMLFEAIAEIAPQYEHKVAIPYGDIRAIVAEKFEACFLRPQQTEPILAEPDGLLDRAYHKIEKGAFTREKALELVKKLYIESLYAKYQKDTAGFYGQIPLNFAATTAKLNEDLALAETIGQGDSRLQALAGVTAAEFSTTEYATTWLVNNVMTQGQPAVLGGPMKSMKTSIMLDLALSLAASQVEQPSYFLGKFLVPEQVGVAIWSGESGASTIKETALRICKSKGIELADTLTLWSFTAPRLSDQTELRTIKKTLRDGGYSVAAFDPLYLTLLSGSEGKSAASLFDMGPVLADLCAACLEAGATPLLAHHTPKNRHDPRDRFEPLELQELAFAGVAEFARQWILVNRREKYVGEGIHRLWLGIGGSAGFGRTLGLDITEGTVDEHFHGRVWDVTTMTAEQAREAAKEEKQDAAADKKHREEAALEKKILAYLAENAEGDSETAIAKAVGKDKATRIRPATERLVQNQQIVHVAKLTKGKRAGCPGWKKYISQALEDEDEDIVIEDAA